MYYIFFVHLAVHEHLSCCNIMDFMKNAAINMGVYITIKYSNFSSVQYTTWNGIAGWYGRSVSNFWGNFIWLHQFAFLPAMYNGFNFSTAFPIIIFKKNNRHVNRSKVVFHCSSDLHLPDISAICNNKDDPGRPYTKWN